MQKEGQMACPWTEIKGPSFIWTCFSKWGLPKDVKAPCLLYKGTLLAHYKLPFWSPGLNFLGSLNNEKPSSVNSWKCLPQTLSSDYNVSRETVSHLTNITFSIKGSNMLDMLFKFSAWASFWHLLEMQTVRPHPGPTEPEAAVSQDPHGTWMQVKVWAAQGWSPSIQCSDSLGRSIVVSHIPKNNWNSSCYNATWNRTKFNLRVI